jgi:hypothetical protein
MTKVSYWGIERSDNDNCKTELIVDNLLTPFLPTVLLTTWRFLLWSRNDDDEARGVNINDKEMSPLPLR